MAFEKLYARVIFQINEYKFVSMGTEKDQCSAGEHKKEIGAYFLFSFFKRGV